MPTAGTLLRGYLLRFTTCGQPHSILCFCAFCGQIKRSENTSGQSHVFCSARAATVSRQSACLRARLVHTPCIVVAHYNTVYQPADGTSVLGQGIVSTAETSLEITLVD